MEAVQPHEDPVYDHDPADDPQGEFVSLDEALIVAPGWGKLRRVRIEPGEHIEAGAVVAHVEADGRGSHAVRSVVHGTFVAWMAWEGESVGPGTPVARLSLNGNP